MKGAQMTIKYYLAKLCWGLIAVAAFTNLWLEDSSSKSFFFFILSIVNALLYPFGMFAIKTIVLKFSTEEFWQKDFFTSPIGGSLPAILYVFCFIFAIPLSIVFLIQRIISHSQHQTRKTKRW